MTSTIQPRLLTAKQAAAYLGLCRRSFYIYRPAMGLTPMIIGKKKKWDVRDLDNYIERKKNETSD